MVSGTGQAVIVLGAAEVVVAALEVVVDAALLVVVETAEVVDAEGITLYPFDPAMTTWKSAQY